MRMWGFIGGKSLRGNELRSQDKIEQYYRNTIDEITIRDLELLILLNFHH